MKITILETGAVPPALADRFPSYPDMFGAMFARHGASFQTEVVKVHAGAPLPDPAGLEAVLLTGSPAGVYEDHAWLPPLRDFIRRAHGAGTRMVGICFGHQIIADALGGVVRKSEKGWGLGRHRYRVTARPPHFMPGAETLAITCSHQDQVIAAPAGAQIVLGNDFAPNAGLLYANGNVLSFQPHPEFEDDFAGALIELRRGRAPDDLIETARASMALASDSPVLAGAITRFLLA